ncbi:type II/IV secretion system ATPase subunit [Candidatus Woesearchaeota archaeon]|nr:type II/IV secretion system ATPase subunit [Candidatus Woesearchaeota archaeon]
MAIPFINKIVKNNKKPLEAPLPSTIPLPAAKPSAAPRLPTPAGTDEAEPFYIDLRPKIVTLPDVKDKKDINIRYPLIPPFAFAHIFWDDENKELVYAVEEPVLSDAEKELLVLVKSGLEEMINISFVRATKTNLLIKYLEQNVKSILTELGTKVSKETYDKLLYYVVRDSIGLNQIEPLMRDYYIEDIECNGDQYPLYIVHRKFANIRTNVIFTQREELVNFVEKLSQKAGRYVSYARPLLDGALPDGSRVNATYTEDVTTRGPTFTIRKFTRDPWSPLHLVKFKTVNEEILAFIWLAIESRANIMFIGETAAGKTTFMNAISQFIPPEARICSIEDTRELNLVHINWLPSVTRAGFGIPTILGTQYGEITLFDLLKETFRQAPDYVILGETRGEETYVLFQGMASGHPSFATFHAASVETMVRRFETPPINLPASLVASLDIVLVITHIKTPEKSYRRMKEFVEIIDVPPEIGRVNSNTLFKWDAIKDIFAYSGKSVMLKKISSRTGVSERDLLIEVDKRARLLRKMLESNIIEFNEVAKVINAYYKDKESVLRHFGI